jgi:molecular chaperone DnaK
MDTYSGEWMGIDLGTYNSSAAVKSSDGNIEIIRSTGMKGRGMFFDKQEKFKEFPSFISFDKNGSVDEIGMIGKERAYSEPEFVVWGIKRLLGKTYMELKESGELDRFPYRIRPDRKNGQCLIVIAEKSYTPIQLCAEIFKKIRSEAEKQTGKNINSVVVSVPAYFDPLRVTPVIEAARLAGFMNVKSIPEPVAAALVYKMEISVRPRNVLVFDLGAGTLDVTTGYLYRHPDQPNEFKFQVMKNTGDPKLGGIDMDDRMMSLIQRKCELNNLGSVDAAALRRAAEIAKIRLSEENDIEQTIKAGGKEYRCRLSQLDLRMAVEGCGGEKNLLDECRRQIMSAIEEAGWTTQDIELLIMIGGPTKLSCIHDVFKVIFYDRPEILCQLEEFYSGNEQVDRMTAVSAGAAMSANLRIDDKVPYGHGIEDLIFIGKEVSYVPKMLVPKDSPYPFRSGQYKLGWTNTYGLFEIKIIQQVPSSEIAQLGYEYRFMGIQKFAVKNPGNCSVVFQMGYNANRELEVNIRNILSNESVTYVGINQYACIGMDYPLSVKLEPDIAKSGGKKTEPSKETLDRLEKWTGIVVGFIRRKADGYPVPQMMLTQIMDEIGSLLNKENPGRDYEIIYTKLNSLIWNANSRGLLKQEEYSEIFNRLTDFEGELFRRG